MTSDVSAELSRALAMPPTAATSRQPTAAHPLCRCGRPYTPTCRTCLAKPNRPCRWQWGDPLVLSPTGLAKAHYRAPTRLGTKADCPMHRPDHTPADLKETDR